MGILGSLGLTPKALLSKGLGQISPVLGQVVGMLGGGGGAGQMSPSRSGGFQQPNLVDTSTDPFLQKHQQENQMYQDMLQQINQPQSANPYLDIQNVFRQRFGQV